MTTNAAQSALSLEYVSVLVTATGGSPTGGSVEMAFILHGNPTTDDWNPATWAQDTSLPETQGLAQCLVGPGGTITLTAGTYKIWVQVAAHPEVPVLPAGTLSIY